MAHDARSLEGEFARDAEARRRALTDLDSTLLVEAGAGSGKTSVLAGRVVMLLAAGCKPAEIAAISFTEMSASELRERVVRFVGEVLHGTVPLDLQAALPNGLSSAQRTALEAAAASLDTLACTTIHGFCRMLLTPYPVEACIDPGAAVADEETANLMFADALGDWLQAKLAEAADPDGPVAALFLAGEKQPEGLLAELAGQLRKYRGARTDTYPPEGEAIARLRKAVKAMRNAAKPWPEPETELIAADLLAMLADLPPAGTGRVPALLALIRLAAPESCCTGSGGFKAFRRLGKFRTALKGRASQAEADRQHDHAAAFYEACKEAHADVVAAAAGCLLALLGAELAEVVASFHEAKRAAALLDFDDLLHGARDLLARCDDIRHALGARFRHVLVDEFQDTDPLQAEILWRLCGDPPADHPDAPFLAWPLRDGALFIVGDPKQAIYRFRGADVRTYVAARTALATAHPQSVLSIGRNFRSVMPVLEFVNDRFAAPLSVAGQPGFATLFSNQAAPEGHASVMALDIEVPGGGADDIRDAEAEAVADTCARLIGAYPVRARAGGMRPCQAGDIALLAPTSKDLWRYERALENRALPVATQAGKGFFRRQEIQDLIALAGVLADPRDTLALGALLRGPLVGFTEEALLDALEAMPHQDGRPPRLRLWLEIADVRDPPLRETLDILQGLARRARSTTPFVLLSSAVEEMRVRPVLRQRGGRSAERALANIDAFLDLSRAWDVRGLHAFAQAMRTSWEDESSSGEARPDAEQHAVSLVTMHSAKGLEWSVVIPINTATGTRAVQPPVLDRATGILHASLLGVAPPGCDVAVAAEKTQIDLERQRLWYVATTRARDLLLLSRPSCSLRANAWASVVDLGLQGLPAFDASGLPPSALPPLDTAVNTQDRATYETEAAVMGMRAARIVRLTPSRGEDDGTLAEELPLPLDEQGDGERQALPQGGRGRGLVLHKLMEEVLTGETQDDLASLVQRAAVLLATCGDAIDAYDQNELAATVRRTLYLPEIAALRPRLVAEFPVYSSIQSCADEEITAGIADALAVEPDGSFSVVIDWKSDVAPLTQTIAGYERQVRAYLRATGIPRGLIVLMTKGLVVPVSAAGSA